MLRTGIYLQGRYEILGLIGSGGMSDVYRARCHKLNRLVAIKVLKKEFSREEGFVGKFQMEAQAAAQIQPAAQTAVQDSQTTQAEDEESAFFLLFMGGGLLIILFAVISAMSTVSGAISIAVNMDVDGE